ncbi:MAG: hypothetical protein LBH59_06220, partial [Planctomycetaceae bacterium]|nr:hypothetical protein [Planctomycetaceae bacterium]
MTNTSQQTSNGNPNANNTTNPNNQNGNNTQTTQAQSNTTITSTTAITASNTSIPTTTSTVSQRKTRRERVTLHMAPQGQFAKMITNMRQEHYVMILLIMFLTSLAISAILGAWDPPFTYRLHNIVHRAIVCNTHFKVNSPSAKEYEIERVRKNAVHIFENDVESLNNLRESLWSVISTFVNARNYDRLTQKEREIWNLFLTPRDQQQIPPNIEPQEEFTTFISHFNDQKMINQLNDQLRIVFSNYGIHGLITSLDFTANEGNVEKILVYPKGKSPEQAVEFKLREVQISDGSSLRELLKKYLPKEMQNDTFVNQIFNWIYPQLNSTLTENKNATALTIKAQVDAVTDIYIDYAPGRILVDSNSTLDLASLMLLRAEYDAAMENRAENNQLRRIVRYGSLVITNMILFIVSWGFLQKRERRRPQTPKSFLFLMTLIILTVAASRLLHGGTLTNAEWELLPVLVFVMTVSIMYSWELAVVLSFVMVLMISLGGGGSIGTLIVLFSVTIATAIQLGRLRSRNKLLLVSFNA